MRSSQIVLPSERIVDTERDPSFETYWAATTRHFQRIFYENEFENPCTVCDRLWFQNDLKPAKEAYYNILTPLFGSIVHSVCSNCRQALDRGKIPQLSSTNDFNYPNMPRTLPKLDPISRRLVSPRIPFMTIRRLRRDCNYGIIGQVINMPVDVSTMVRSLPRLIDDDFSINVAIK